MLADVLLPRWWPSDYSAWVSSHPLYVTPVDPPELRVPGSFETIFNWEYDTMRDQLLTLYRKGKSKQWDSEVRIKWSQDVDPENPSQMPDEFNVGIYGSPIWNSMSGKDKTELRLHIEAWRISQFLHGEQGALICASKIVQTVPDMDSKFYAATQVIDEARHVETYSRYLHEKLQLAYPINPSLKILLEQVISDSRWDFTYLGMQVLIEGLALAAFSMIRDVAQNPLAASINAYVMQDEARHVAFGRLALRDFYPQITEKERDEREDFIVEACYLMRDRFKAREIWETLGMNRKACDTYVENSERMQRFRRMLFMRIVPIVRDIGLWGPRVQKAYADMGVLDFATVDPDAAALDDERIAEQFDARQAYIDETIAAAD